MSLVKQDAAHKGFCWTFDKPFESFATRAHGCELLIINHNSGSRSCSSLRRSVLVFGGTHFAIYTGSGLGTGKRNYRFLFWWP